MADHVGLLLVPQFARIPGERPTSHDFGYDGRPRWITFGTAIRQNSGGAAEVSRLRLRWPPTLDYFWYRNSSEFRGERRTFQALGYDGRPRWITFGTAIRQNSGGRADVSRLRLRWPPTLDYFWYRNSPEFRGSGRRLTTSATMAGHVGLLLVPQFVRIPGERPKSHDFGYDGRPRWITFCSGSRQNSGGAAKVSRLRLRWPATSDHFL